ncbi:MAG: SDR family NAD(P)-dependent oxidoreductase [Actinomycetota bacterium]
MRRARDEAVATFGAIHHLVNSAGLVRMSALDDLDEEGWDLVVDTNLKGMSWSHRPWRRRSATRAAARS